MRTKTGQINKIKKENMMKKLILVLLLVLTFGLIACEEPHTHEYGEWVVVKEATEAEEGLKERTCSCGEKETEKIEKLAHTHEYGEWVVVKEATEAEEGLMARRRASRCFLISSILLSASVFCSSSCARIASLFLAPS